MKSRESNGISRRDLLKTSAVAATVAAIPSSLAKNAYAAGTTNPIPGRLEGTTAFFHEKDGVKKSNKSYPSWYRGNGKNGLADKNSLYYYIELIGPKAFVKDGHQNEYFYMGTLELKPNEVYPAHNHPSSEVYYVISGEAQWFVDDESQIVVAGDTIYHKPYSTHGWKNLSDKEPLRMAFIWWSEGDTAVLSKGARFTNPDLFESKENIKPYAVPLPKVRMNENDKVNGKYGEYPVPGRLVGDSAFANECSIPKKATKTHPTWFRGTGANGIADENAKYFYHEIVGPNLNRPAFDNDYLYFGSLEQKAGYTYPAHNHPAAEIYFILEGEADWYVDDEKQKVTAGSIIYHRPYASHGWKVTSKKPLKMIWAWWVEEDMTVLNTSAKMVNPDLAKSEKTALPYPQPIPSVRNK